MSKHQNEKTNEAAGSHEDEIKNNADEIENAAEKPQDKSEEQIVELTPEQKITDLEKQLAESHDQFLRKAADFENFRKRMNLEKQSSIEYANQSLLLDIIPIIDDLERAIQLGETAADIGAFLDGLKMIEKRLTSQLESKWGLKRFDSAGELFDPNRHEALMVEKSPDVKETIVKEDFQKGYLLKERVIRSAKVKVIMPEENENN